MSTPEKLVEGAFRALLICSAVYFGAKYSPYILHIADNVKERIIPGSSHHSTNSDDAVGNGYQRFQDPPQTMMRTNPRLYNAITIDNLVQQFVEQEEKPNLWQYTQGVRQ